MKYHSHTSYIHISQIIPHVVITHMLIIYICTWMMYKYAFTSLGYWG